MKSQLHPLETFIPLSDLNEGHAEEVFEQLQQKQKMIVIKEQQPVGVLLSLDEYMRLAEIEENWALFTLAQERLANNNIVNAIPEEDVLASLGMTAEDIEAADDDEITSFSF